MNSGIYEELNFGVAYEKIIEILKNFLDMDEKYYPIVALWIMGTHFHDDFRTYPYLYLNASKGSGKTRLLKLIAFLAKNGRLIGLPSEAYLFRSAKKFTFCLDELENIERKESQDLRLLLNSCYKKGLFIPRMKKEKDGGEMVAEEFEAYAPFSLANIWGLEDVLQDRCITVILEKSEKKYITRKIEAWDLDGRVLSVKSWLESVKNTPDIWFGVVSCMNIGVFNQITTLWNDVLDSIGNTLTTHNYTTTLPTTTYTKLHITTPEEFDNAFTGLDWISGKYGIEFNKGLLEFFKKIYMTDLDGRELELYFPLFVMASFVSDEIFSQVIDIAKAETTQKKIDEVIENKDASLVSALLYFIHDKQPNEWYRITEIKDFLVDSVGDEIQRKDGSMSKTVPLWLNQKWIGRALKRMNLTTNKKRGNTGFQVMLNFEKIRDKARILGVEVTGVSKQTTLEEVSDIEVMGEDKDETDV